MFIGWGRKAPANAGGLFGWGGVSSGWVDSDRQVAGVGRCRSRRCGIGPKKRVEGGVFQEKGCVGAYTERKPGGGPGLVGSGTLNDSVH